MIMTIFCVGSSEALPYMHVPVKSKRPKSILAKEEELLPKEGASLGLFD